MSIETALHVVVLTLACALVGFPFAVLLARGAARSLTSLVVQGVFLGLAAALAVALVVAHTVGISRLSVGLALSGLAAVAWARAAGEIAALPRPTFTWPGAALAAVGAGALALRLEPVYFLAQSADFGEYVNRGNIVADGGPFHDWFFQLFSVALGLSHLALGEAATVDLMPFLGMLLLAGLVAIAHELRLAPVALVVGGAVIGFQVVPVWFSLLPTSEALYATLLVGTVLFVLLALQRDHHPEAAIAGALVGLQMVTRGNVVLLLPVLALAMVVAAPLVERRHVRVAMTFVVVATLSSYAGFVFNAVHSHAYLVHQLGLFLPSPRVVAALASVTSPVRFLLGLAGSVVLAALTCGAIGVANRVGSRPGRRLVQARRALLPLVAVALLVVLAVMGASGVAHAVRNYGIVFVVLVAAGVVVALSRVERIDGPSRVLLAIVVLVAGVFALFYAYRRDAPIETAMFLYWDRYLFSEVYPALAVAVFWGADAIVALHRTIVDRLGWPRWRAALPMGAVAALGLFSVLSSTTILRERQFFDGYYETLSAVDEIAGSGDAPLVYVGLEELPEYWFHPNTHRLVAWPLAQTFDRRFLNHNDQPFGPDQVPTWDEVAGILEGAGTDRAYVVSVSPRGEQARAEPVADIADGALPEGIRARPVGVVEMRLPVLDEPVDGDRRWHVFALDIAVAEVELAAS